MPKVLIVEDEKDMREALVEEFAGHGFTVKTAEDGVNGLRIAMESKPDVVVLDLLMPRMNGSSMMKKLHQNGWDATVPVVILTNVELGKHRVEQVVENEPAWYLMKSNNSLKDVRQKTEALLALKEVSIKKPRRNVREL